MKKLKVLSLFNGMNCIGLALKKLGIEFELYASEIDKFANQVSNALFPDTINLGCVTTVDVDQLPVFDLVVAGSPCQGFSFAGKQLNFEDERSKLFFDFVKILDKCKEKNPNVKFLLENVKMKKEYEAVISRFMGIDPIEINSALLSAQNRKRLYWTNIGTIKANLFGIEEPGIKQPKDKKILLKDILEEEVDEKYFLSLKAKKFITNIERLKKKYTAINGEKALCLTAKGVANWTDTFLKIDREGKEKNNQDKASCLSVGGNGMGNHSDMDLIILCGAMRGRYKVDGKRQDSKGSIAGKSTQEIEIRKDDKTNCLTSVQKDNILIIPEANKKGFAEVKNGECFDLTHLASKTRRGRKMLKKSNCMTSGTYDFMRFENSKIRRLTPKECARLQTIPEDAIEIMLNCGVSDSQLYKMFGNGWTIDVIAYILEHEKSFKNFS